MLGVMLRMTIRSAGLDGINSADMLCAIAEVQLKLRVCIDNGRDVKGRVCVYR